MFYVTGVFALNIANELNTCGDWHCSALNWNNVWIEDSTKTIFGDWGIEQNKLIPCYTTLYNVANDLRAILDLMYANNLGYLKGFYEDFICTDEYNDVFFKQVLKLRQVPHWNDIHSLMQYEFMFKWDTFSKEILM